jgi:DNA excision repair protein ERCC-2
VSFPYPYVYPEQLDYMKTLKRLLDQEGHGILEMPTGTGKTVCLLALTVSYIKFKKPNFKLVYCTRTIVEMEKTLEELKSVMANRTLDFKDDDPCLSSSVLALCLSARKNLCIHPRVGQEEDRVTVDSMCRQLTNPWQRMKAKEQQQSEMQDIENISENETTCSFFEKFDENQEKITLPNGIYTLDDLKAYGESEGICPYFLARRFLLKSNIIVFNYSYMLDPKIANIVSAEL